MYIYIGIIYRVLLLSLLSNLLSHIIQPVYSDLLYTYDGRCFCCWSTFFIASPYTTLRIQQAVLVYRPIVYILLGSSEMFLYIADRLHDDWYILANRLNRQFHYLFNIYIALYLYTCCIYVYVCCLLKKCSSGLRVLYIEYNSPCVFPFICVSAVWSNFIVDAVNSSWWLFVYTTTTRLLYIILYTP